MNGYLLTRADTQLSTDETKLLHRLREAAIGSELHWVSAADHADVVVLFEQWSYKTWRYAELLLSCAVIQRYAERLLVVNYDDAARAFLPGLYASLPLALNDPRRFRSICFPESINDIVECSGRGPSEWRPQWLATFRGHPETSNIRGALSMLLGDRPEYSIKWVRKDLHDHTNKEMADYASEISDSAFVLCPRGWAPSSYRIYEAMALGRCPVIISDDWVPPQGPHWHECSIRVAESEVESIPDILERRRDEARELGSCAYKAWRQFFMPDVRFRQYVAELISVAQQRPWLKLDEYRNLWRSRKFLRERGWTLGQRMVGRVRKVIREARRRVGNGLH